MAYGLNCKRRAPVTGYCTCLAQVRKGSENAFVWSLVFPCIDFLHTDCTANKYFNIKSHTREDSLYITWSNKPRLRIDSFIWFPYSGLLDRLRAAYFLTGGKFISPCRRRSLGVLQVTLPSLTGFIVQIHSQFFARTRRTSSSLFPPRQVHCWSL